MDAVDAGLAAAVSRRRLLARVALGSAGLARRRRWRNGWSTCTVRYRCYISRRLHQRSADAVADPGRDGKDGVRIPALELETAVGTRIAEAFQDR